MATERAHAMLGTIGRLVGSDWLCLLNCPLLKESDGRLKRKSSMPCSNQHDSPELSEHKTTSRKPTKIPARALSGRSLSASWPGLWAVPSSTKKMQKRGHRPSISIVDAEGLVDSIVKDRKCDCEGLAPWNCKAESQKKMTHESHVTHWPGTNIHLAMCQNPVPPVNLSMPAKIEHNGCTYPNMGSKTVLTIAASPACSGLSGLAASKAKASSMRPNCITNSSHESCGRHLRLADLRWVWVKIRPLGDRRF